MTSPAETRAGKCCSSAPGTDGIGVPDSTGTGAGRRYEGDIAVVGQTVAVGRTEHSVGSRGAAWKVVGRNRRVGQSPALARLERRATPQRHMVKVVRPVGGCSCRTEDCQTCLEECVRRRCRDWIEEESAVSVSACGGGPRSNTNSLSILLCCCTAHAASRIASPTADKIGEWSTTKDRMP